MKSMVFFLGLVLTAQLAGAEDDIPLIRPEEQRAVDSQAKEFNDAVMPLLREVSKSTVRVWSGPRRLAYGTVVGDGSVILTKWSEIAQARTRLRVEAEGREPLGVKLKGVYEAEDLAVLELEGEKLPAVRWASGERELGSFLVAVQPDGRPAGFGVVSVLERNLRETDKAFLGVTGDDEYRGVGVKIGTVSEGSGAADAGLVKGDVILKVNGREISGLLELKNSLTGVKPGDEVKIRVLGGGRERDVTVVLGNRPDMPQFSGQRLEQMERMGGEVSRVRNSFSAVIQSDMRLNPNQVGGPVVDLKGNAVGMTLARADRTRSFVMTGERIEELLKTDMATPELAMAKPEVEKEQTTRRVMGGKRMPQTSEEQLLQHLDDMERLMEHMRAEMEALEERESRR